MEDLATIVQVYLRILRVSIVLDRRKQIRPTKPLGLGVIVVPSPTKASKMFGIGVQRYECYCTTSIKVLILCLFDENLHLMKNPIVDITITF